LFEDGGGIEAAGILSIDKSWHSLHFLLNGSVARFRSAVQYSVRRAGVWR
jgi:hypothetical protein